VKIRVGVELNDSEKVSVFNTFRPTKQSYASHIKSIIFIYLVTNSVDSDVIQESRVNSARAYMLQVHGCCSAHCTV